MNRKIALWTLGAALIAVPGFAAPGAGPRGDADGNGTLTRAEAETHAARMFARMDANGDGRLDAADRSARHAEMQARMFERIDADKDGSISRAEWDQHGADRAAKRAERDGTRAAAGEGRMGKRRAMRGHHATMISKADTNGDKAISEAEFQTAALARFDAADANRDGQVTAEERQSAREAKRSGWRAKRAATPIGE